MKPLPPFFIFFLVILSPEDLGFAFAKLCTNAFPPLSSHTLRHELQTSKNETWRKEVFSHYHLTPTDESAWSELLPRKLLLEERAERDWAAAYRRIKYSSGAQGILGEVSLHDVRLGPGSAHGVAQQTNLEYLLLLDVDRLVWSFRKTAGLETAGKPYGGWEEPDSELRGHFVGHYLSATAQMWASTHNESLRAKMTELVSALSACQQKIGTGYLSAFPTELFDRLEALVPVWAPYYTIHKILAGLVDQYSLAGNEQALKMAKWMVDYFYSRVQSVISKFTIRRHWESLNEESGGMNDVLYRLYTITGDQRHLVLGHLFDKPCFLGLLAMKADDISDFHSNTHIPLVVGSQMRYEVTGDPLYKEIGTYFMDIVNSSHSYATGGTSAGEFWQDPNRLADTLGTENEESCTTYNMLKVSRYLFRWTKEMAYADYYERALTNGVLSIQRGTDPGVMIYMLPQGPGVSKAVSYHGWGTPFDSFWCCYGTGIESFSKLGDSIYFEERGNTPSLYVIQYISSSFDWRLGKISLKQEVEPFVSWDPRLRVTFTFAAASEEGSLSGSTTVINFRIPFWTTSGSAKATLNGHNMALPSPGNFLSVSRTWSPGDKITFDLPITLRTEAIKDDRPKYASLHAVFYGPYLLAGLSTGDSSNLNTKSAKSFSDWITPIPANSNSLLISLSQEDSLVLTNSNNTLEMQNFTPPGTNAAVRSSFKLVPKDSGRFSNPQDAIGKLVVLEPFDFPGWAIVHYGPDKNLGVAGKSNFEGSVFRLGVGLDGRNDSVSLEADDQKGCFMCSGKNESGVRLGCGSRFSDEGFKRSASFVMGKGRSEYHPVSFVAKGVERDFVLFPLISIRDENYTVYFNMGL
ncbi:phosphorylase b kinase gamma catalytic chain [Striga asiatica]|uniref:Phosphorylase b kinase gamma catalytic chain n=1 Tax=Striga asiatica TaxID=4170 RepID=A0A5A7RCE1_STRAF|nr:phosphorylase b kinase gamma catalytic chain [Striga asiatica]